MVWQHVTRFFTYFGTLYQFTNRIQCLHNKTFWTLSRFQHLIDLSFDVLWLAETCRGAYNGLCKQNCDNILEFRIMVSFLMRHDVQFTIERDEWAERSENDRKFTSVCNPWIRRYVNFYFVSWFGIGWSLQCTHANFTLPLWLARFEFRRFRCIGIWILMTDDRIVISVDPSRHRIHVVRTVASHCFGVQADSYRPQKFKIWINKWNVHYGRQNWITTQAKLDSAPRPLASEGFRQRPRN